LGGTRAPGTQCKPSNWRCTVTWIWISRSSATSGVTRWHLDRDGPVQSHIARPVDAAHSSGPDEILDPIRSQLAARGKRSAVVEQFGGDIHCRLIDQGIGAIRGQQRFHFPPQGRVAGAGCGDESGPRFRPVLQRLVVDLLDASPFFLTQSRLCHIHPSTVLKSLRQRDGSPQGWPPPFLL
jgi:hypothetical protein